MAASPMSRRIHLLAVLAASVLPFLNSLRNGFVWDDPRLIFEYQAHEQLPQRPGSPADLAPEVRLRDLVRQGHFRGAFEHPIQGYYRPFYTLSYILDYGFWNNRRAFHSFWLAPEADLPPREIEQDPARVSAWLEDRQNVPPGERGANPAGFHLFNILLHAATAVLVWVTALALRLPPPAALLAGLAFGLHPIHSEAVAWVSGRPAGLCAFFWLLGTFLFLKGIGPLPGPKPRPLRFALLVQVPIAYLCALLTKEEGLTMAPFLAGTAALGLLGRVGREDPGPFLPALARSGALLAALGGVFVLLGFFRIGSIQGALPLGLLLLAAFGVARLRAEARFPAGIAFFLGALLLGRYLETREKVVGEIPDLVPLPEAPGVLLTFLAVTARHVGHLLAPLSFNAFPLNDRVLLGSLEPAAGIAGLALAAALFLRRPSLRFPIALFAAGLVPFTNLVAMNPPPDIPFYMAERFLYLPSAAFALAFGLAVARARPALGRAAPPVLGVLLAFYAFQTVERNRVFRDDLAFFDAAAAASPRSPSVAKNRGDVLRLRGRLSDAAAEYARAAALQPENDGRVQDLASIRFLLAKAHEAGEEYPAAAAAFGEALAGYRRVLQALEGPSPRRAAIESMEGECLWAVSRCRARGLRRDGNGESALAEMERARREQPRRTGALFEMAEILFERGDRGRARGLYLQYLDEDGGARPEDLRDHETARRRLREAEE